MKTYLAIAFLAALVATQAEAKSFHDMFGTDAPEGGAGAILKTIDFQQGPIKLPGANATLNVSDQFYYLNPADTRKVLVQLWGNPGNAAEGTLGMIFPAKYAPTDQRTWGAVVEYDNGGHVSDDDAASTDYNALLKQIQDAIKGDNPEREKQGYPSITLVGWAEPPHYDKATHALHWARDLVFGKDPSGPHTLNYSVRVLGREGVMELDFVAGLNQLQEINNAIPNVINTVQYDSGKRYADFVNGDKIAAYSMAGMIAAGAGVKIAAKLGFLAVVLGFFKSFGVALLALKKGLIVIIAGIAALGRKILGLFRRDKSTDA
ncbi:MULTISPECIES: DUF2167 domain-containing protein [unclassified Rhizobium]|uniref:DUF2167 domain-containing protein n=1 Tax=unclassified Rhizobium TaxID=2613769 RepID=UPI000CDF50F6|nr:MULTISPECIES: DUF2167 domain-containing protein [Rhizobium]AVA21170.1 hypothetical protein NXC24_CH01511 [Rhizobium sp. NXC24]MDK4739313.1 DUF2167 domain-containing protein [Rhizobium sp. CNPSo 3464]UWU22361.1 DUF2167 domain-containing protein [Rhizobium tropici]